MGSIVVCNAHWIPVPVLQLQEVLQCCTTGSSIDVRTSGRWSDGGTFENCSLNAAMENGQLIVPSDAVLRGRSTFNFSVLFLAVAYHYRFKAKWF